jgi:hypothetical protein
MYEVEGELYVGRETSTLCATKMRLNSKLVEIGSIVDGFSVGDQVVAMADNTYAELCVVNAAVLAKKVTI